MPPETRSRYSPRREITVDDLSPELVVQWLVKNGRFAVYDTALETYCGYDLTMEDALIEIEGHESDGGDVDDLELLLSNPFPFKRKRTVSLFIRENKVFG